MVAEILKQWNELWAAPWQLDQETLLCANGLEAFPNTLKCAQIVIAKADESRLADLTLPENLAIRTVEALKETDYVSCGGITYPVRSDYREYLEETFGDYENGMHDDIGVGLTAEEKIALKNHQAKCLEALIFVQELSQKYNLRYYLLAGSVLGPVRHGGFIPWDDDVDIGIRIEDLEHFEEMVKANLPAGFTLVQAAANHPYPRMFSKICFNGRCCIDLWPLVPIPFDGIKAKFTWFFSKLIAKMHYCKIGYPVPKHGKLAKICSVLLTDNAIMKLARWNERKALGKAPAYINLYSVYSRQKETIPLEWLEVPATADFCGLEVPVVGRTHEYLTHLYGDYMTPPPPWKRASRHFERFHY